MVFGCFVISFQAILFGYGYGFSTPVLSVVPFDLVINPAYFLSNNGLRYEIRAKALLSSPVSTQ